MLVLNLTALAYRGSGGVGDLDTSIKMPSTVINGNATHAENHPKRKLQPRSKCIRTILRGRRPEMNTTVGRTVERQLPETRAFKPPSPPSVPEAPSSNQPPSATAPQLARVVSRIGGLVWCFLKLRHEELRIRQQKLYSDIN